MALNTPTGQPSGNQVTDFTGASVPNTIGYKFTELDPGANIYVQRDDQLVIQAISFSSAEVLNVNVRLLQPGHPKGRTQPDPTTKDNPLGDSLYGVIVPINVMVPSTGAQLLFTRVMQLAEGYLMSVAVSATVANQRGQTFVRVFILRGSANVANVSYLLAADYVTNNFSAAWPNGDVRSPLDGSGQIVELGPANPGAGLDFGIALANLTRVRILSVSATLTTSAAVANRIVSGLIFNTSAGKTSGNYPANIAIPATTVARVTFGSGSTGPALGATIVNVNLPEPTILCANNSIAVNFQSLTANIQAGDQWSNISAIVETWFDI